MGLKRGSSPGSVTVVDDPDEAPEIPDDVPRHGNPNDGRPRIRLVDDPTRMEFYARASKFGKDIGNSFLIDRADKRNVVYGLSRRDDLVMEAAAVAGLEEKGDRRALERIAEDAIAAAGGRDAARKGSAFHKLRERVDAGEDMAWLGPKAWAALQAWSAIADRFTWHGSEQFVVCDRWGAAGTYDSLWSPRWPMVAPDGTVIEPGSRLIVDLKSGRWGREMWGPKGAYGVQLPIYAHGVPYVHVDDAAAEGRLGPGFDPTLTPDNGRREWLDGIAPRTDWALIPHVPVDSPDDAELVWVDLRKGAERAEVAALLREMGRDELFFPAELPDPVSGLLVLVERVEGEQQLDALYAEHRTVWGEVHTAAARARMQVLTSASTQVSA